MFCGVKSYYYATWCFSEEMVSLVIVLQNTIANQLHFLIVETLCKNLKKKPIFFMENRGGGLKTVAGSGNESGLW